MSARRLLWRWNWRVLRREWRQHVVIFSLIFAGVALSVSGAVAAYNLAEPPETQFGGGKIAVTADDSEALEQSLRQSRHRFGIRQSTTLRVDGTAQRLDVRTADPLNPMTAPLISLVEGRFPTGPDEVAVTDRALVDTAVVGQTVSISGSPLVVVAIVENPTRLADEFAFVSTLDEFAVSSQDVNTEYLVDTTEDQLQLTGVTDFGITSIGGPPIRTAITLLVSVVSAFGMLEVALLVGAGFAVLTKRRSRQYGLLAAAGASPRHIRLVATSMGTLLGLAGALAGLVTGLAAMRLLLPQMERAIGHRVAFAVPWWTVLPSALLAVVVASVAARWPTRPLAKLPVARLLSSLRPQPSTVGAPAAIGVVLAIAGALLLGVGFSRVNLLLSVLGVLLAPIGILLTTPLLVSFVGRGSTKLRVAARMGGRSIGRHNRQSAAVVAALGLALAIPVGVTVITASLDRHRAAQGPNLAENSFIAWQPGADDATIRVPMNLDDDALRDAALLLREAAPQLTLTPIQTAASAQPMVERWEFDALGSQLGLEPLLAGRPGDENCLVCDTYGFGETDENGDEIVYVVEDLWIGAPDLVSALGLDPQLLINAAGLAADDRYRIIGLEPNEPLTVPDQWPPNSRVPPLLLAPDLVGASDLVRHTLGWYVSSNAPITEDLRETVRRAIGPTLLLEFPAEPEARSGIRQAALAIGILLGLAIALSTVGLFTTELANDLHILSALGASPRTTRDLSGSVAAMLAAAGALLGVAIGYLPLLPLVSSDEPDLPFVIPWMSLGGLIFVFPLMAGLIGWALSRPAGSANATL